MDKNVSLFTCKDASVVDYIISSPCLIRSLIDFQVLDFDSILSDGHCPLFLHIEAFGEGSSGCKETFKGNASEGIHKKIIWKNGSRAAFTARIDLSAVGELCAFMDQHNNDNIDVNISVDKCNKILYNVAE